MPPQRKYLWNKSTRRVVLLTNRQRPVPRSPADNTVRSVKARASASPDGNIQRGNIVSIGTIILIILIVILLGGFSGFGGGPFYGTGYYGGGGLGVVIVILLILILLGRI
jgi:hypothetical protein